jgi:hypothetical protein
MIGLLQTRWLIDWLNVGVERRRGGKKSSQTCSFKVSLLKA